MCFAWYGSLTVHVGDCNLRLYDMCGYARMSASCRAFARRRIHNSSKGSKGYIASTMADAPVPYVYDFVTMPLGSALARTELPPLGGRGWAKLGNHQVRRILERDHMVIYISSNGSSIPYKYVEETEDGSKLRYTRKNQWDLIILRSPQANIVSCVCNNQHVLSIHVLYTCIFIYIYICIYIYIYLSIYNHLIL